MVKRREVLKTGGMLAAATVAENCAPLPDLFQQNERRERGGLLRRVIRDGIDDLARRSHSEGYSAKAEVAGIPKSLEMLVFEKNRTQAIHDVQQLWRVRFAEAHAKVTPKQEWSFEYELRPEERKVVETIDENGDLFSYEQFRSVHPDVLCLHATTEDAEERDTVAHVVKAYVDTNTNYAFHDHSRSGGGFFSAFRDQPLKKQRMTTLYDADGTPRTEERTDYRLSSQFHEQVTAAREQKLAYGESNEGDQSSRTLLEAKQGRIDVMYPMDSFGRLHNYVRSLEVVWQSGIANEGEKERYRDIVRKGFLYWKGVAEEFHGMLPRYCSVHGERLHDATAPDDVTGPSVGALSEISVLLRRIGEDALADEYSGFARSLMATSDRIFLTPVDTESKWPLSRSLGHTDIRAAEALGGDFSTAARSIATHDLPGDGVRVPIARAALVRALLLKGDWTSAERTEVVTHLERACGEMRVYMAMARENTDLYAWDWGERDIDFQQDSSQRAKLFRDKVVATNGFSVDPRALPKRWLEPGIYENVHREWPKAFAAIRELARDTELRRLLQEAGGGRRSESILLVDSFLKDAENFVATLLRDSSAVNKDRHGNPNDLDALYANALPLAIEKNTFHGIRLARGVLRYSAVSGSMEPV